MTLPNRKFGVEIEFVGITPSVAQNAIRNAGVSCQYEDYNHATRNHWKIVRDGSVSVSPGMNGDACGELVSPPLVGETGIEEVRQVLIALSAAGATVNKTCGLHVHVDANDLNAGQILSVVQRYAHFENEINAFMPLSRRNGRWAMTVGGDYVPNLVRNVNRNGNLRSVAGGLNRYYAVNLVSYARYGTVEFRQHSGSVNATKVCNWIQFCVHFVTRAAISPFVSEPTATVSSTTAVRSRSGRRPNYNARRELIRLLSNPEYQYQHRIRLAAASGFAESRLTTHGTIMNEIRQFADVYVRGWSYRITITNQAMANVWMGLEQATSPENTPVRGGVRVNRTASLNLRVAPVSGEETLFMNMPDEIRNFYHERASEFA
jgi:hypothetical protein